MPLNDIRFWDADLGWAAGDDGVYRTLNGGENWSLFSTNDDVEAVYFISQTEGWLCGNDGMLMHTTDGGASWQNQSSGVGEKLRDLWFTDTNNGWAVGRDGILIHTSNGGAAWSSQSSPATDDLRGIHMLNSQTGWIVGSDGLIIFTSNGGSSWSTQLSVPGGEEDEFEAVFALDSDHAWAVGGQGRIYATIDGATWSAQQSGTGVALMDVFFTDSDNGWTCGAGGFLSRTNTSGADWNTQPPPAFASFNSIWFVNENLGFMAAGNGSIFKYETESDPSPSPSHVVNIQNFAFDPIELQIDIGDTVRWINLDSVPHTATADDGEFDSGNLDPGEYFDYIFTTEGVFSYTCEYHPAMTGTITVGEIDAVDDLENLIATSIDLAPAYPNPFNPSTTLSLTNPRTQHIRLAVYDILGREVASLHDAPLEPGKHSFRFEATGLASGLYIAQVQAGDFKTARKLTLTK
jgi:photosystem II stability/assembly factor-like uncharacterized protein